MCSSMRLVERAARWPSSSCAACRPCRMNSMYWPARYCSRSLAGSCSVQRSRRRGAAARSSCTRLGILRDRECRRRRGTVARLDHEVGLRPRWQVSAMPCAFSSSVSAFVWCDAVVDAAFDEPALAGAAGAVLAAVGQPMPWRSAAREHGFVVLDVEVRPLGCRVTRSYR